MDIERELRRVLDRQQLVDLVHAYCRGVDTVDPDLVASLFTDDCVVDYGPGLGTPARGSAELRDRLDGGLPRFAATSHHVSNIEIVFDDGPDETGDRATGITYLMAWHRYDDGRPDAILYARYHDTFVRRGDGWAIATRTLRVAGQTEFDVAWHPIGRRAS